MNGLTQLIIQKSFCINNALINNNKMAAPLQAFLLIPLNAYQYFPLQPPPIHHIFSTINPLFSTSSRFVGTFSTRFCYCAYSTTFSKLSAILSASAYRLSLSRSSRYIPSVITAPVTLVKFAHFASSRTICVLFTTSSNSMMLETSAGRR